MADGQIIYCSAITPNPALRIEVAPEQDHVKGKGVAVGRAALAKTPVQVIGKDGSVLEKAAAEKPVAKPEKVLMVPVEPVAESSVPTQTPAPVASVPRPKKVRIQMSGAGMGKVTLYLSRFAASDTLVLLCFPLDNETAIIEPPEAGIDQPVTIVHGPNAYTCFSMGLTVEVNNELVVALPRIRNETR